ncbi:MAG: protein O-mannosyl-transferase family, partial [Caldilineaceae bacterium]
MSPRTHRWAAGALALGLLLLAYLPLLQTIPNGSEHYFMIDAGETQTVLNLWGTLHPTGYPLYVMSGAPLVAVFRALGVGAAAAPGLLSLVTMLGALAGVYAVALRLTNRPWVSAAATVAFGLTRTAWVHAEIAEIYALGLLQLVLLFLIALWPRRPETDARRLYALALLGGLAVAHHRAAALAIPALVYLMWPVLTASPRALPKRLLVCLALGLLGFLPYLWLPLRAQAGAPWVYGDPGTWAGFLDQFLAREAS